MILLNIAYFPSLISKRLFPIAAKCQLHNESCAETKRNLDNARYTRTLYTNTKSRVKPFYRFGTRARFTFLLVFTTFTIRYHRLSTPCLLIRSRNVWRADHLRLLQREARGSVTFKIVPSYRSAPPPCEVQVRPNTQTLSQNTSVASNKPTSSAASTGASSAGGANKSGKSVKTSAAATGKEKTPKAPKASKSKSASSSTESTPRRRLNPLSALRSRKS